MTELETRTMGKVARRIVPFLILCYFVAYLDRVNLAFAALTMNKDLHLSASVFGFGAGIFFLAYFVFEVPSNLMLEKVGARKWIARIMFTWGIVSGAMAFVSGPTSFYVVRTLLGAAEAGFFPGIIFYLTLWFPGIYRGRVVGYFMAAIPMSSVIGAPVSGLLLQLNGVFGIAGWQWLYIAEAVPALILAVVVWNYLTDRPRDATWLEADERAWLVQRLEAERAQRETAHRISAWQALANPKVLALALVYFGAVAVNYGVGFFLPTIIKGFGLTTGMTTLVTAIPYAIGAAGMIWWGLRSDRKMERKGHAAIALALAAAGVAASTMFGSPALRMAAFCVGAFGTFAVLPVF
ncbi:MAG TPA: MFS transporter, partial [Acetobacteraceae bacterium]|nr:MFS transporter [Acetobacteraceae bacterium]